MTDHQLTIGPTDRETVARLYEDVRALGVRADKLDIEAIEMSENDTDDGGVEQIERHSGDHVREALNRHRFEERLAHGEVEGEEVLLVAQLDKGKYPKMFVHAGGEWVQYPEDDVEDEYVGGVAYLVTFENIHSLDRNFDRLRREYDLQEVSAE